MSTWQDSRCVITVNRGDPPARRRFTLCHEFKHVLNANRDSITYKRISAPQRELIAHYFAACYLMPKPLLRHAWTSGIQDPEALAGLFKVSNDAMRRRLTHLQYLDDDTVRPTTSYFRQQASRLAEAARRLPCPACTRSSGAAARTASRTCGSRAAARSRPSSIPRA